MELVFKLAIQVRKKKELYVSSCPALDVFSQGETEKKAVDNIKEAASLFLASCYERGTLEQVLKECGFKPAPRTAHSKAKGTKEISVPLSLVAASH